MPSCLIPTLVRLDFTIVGIAGVALKVFRFGLRVTFHHSLATGQPEQS
jgi:hypothetical protein